MKLNSKSIVGKGMLKKDKYNEANYLNRRSPRETFDFKVSKSH